MARYIGPVCRLCRREDMKLFLKGERCYTDKCGYERRSYPPGQHGQSRRKKRSDYGEQLREKQKVKRIYGIAERQFRGYYHKAVRAKGVSGHTLVQLLERRLDNVIFRAGFARTIPAARQLVNHGHLLIDGKRVDIASFRIQKGMKISFRPRSQKLTTVETGFAIADTFQTPWLTVNRETREATVTNLPDETSILFPLTVQLVIEYYSQRL